MDREGAILRPLGCFKLVPGTSFIIGSVKFITTHSFNGHHIGHDGFSWVFVLPIVRQYFYLPGLFSANSSCRYTNTTAGLYGCLSANPGCATAPGSTQAANNNISVMGMWCDLVASVLSECYPGVPLVCGDACYSGEDSELHLGLSLCLVLYPVKDVGARNPVIMVSELGRLSIFSWDGSLLTWPHKTIQGECSDLFGVNIASDDDDALRLNLPIVVVLVCFAFVLHLHPGCDNFKCIFKF